MKKLIIYGASGHGKVAADIARKNGYEDILFYDDDPSKMEIGPYEVIHSLEGSENCDLFVAIGDNDTRELISKRLKRKIVSLIHPSSVIADDVIIGEGVVVMAGAIINSGSEIGDGVIINTVASIDHDNFVGEYSHISVNSHTAGNVKIGKKVFLGIGTNVINNVCIGDEVKTGAGTVVIRDIADAGTYVGVPARRI